MPTRGLLTLFAAGCAVEPIRGSDDGGAPDAAHEDAAVSGVPDASPVRADAGYGAKDLDDAGDTATSTPDVGEAACAPGVPGCTCVARPPAAGSCVHSYGGVYADGGCSGSYQCCDGAWESSTSACGACVCTDTTGLNGCAAPGSEEQVCFPQWDGTSQPIPTDVQDMMRGKSWHENLECPPFDVLALLRFPYFDFAGDVQRGELIVAATEANALLQVFQALYEAQFPFERIELVHNYGGDDDASMAANNTSAYNCRRTTGGTSWSEHAYGRAIDVNPMCEVGGIFTSCLFASSEGRMPCGRNAV